MANTPLVPNGFTATDPNNPKTYGVVVHYGLNDITVGGIIIDSYKRDAKYAKVDEITGKNGLVEGVRMSDYRVEISVSGRLVEAAGGTSYTDSFTLKVGDVLTVNGDDAVITAVSMNGSASGFATVDISATSYEAISQLAPA